jgi:hypothetical protein
MALVSGGFTFPKTFPFQFGDYTGGVPTTATNSGDSITTVIVSINGPCANPIVTNSTTGELIQLNITLTAGDVLTVNTKFGSKSVVLIDSDGNMSNQMATLDPSSTFWQLAIGDNQIIFSDDTQGGSESCTVAWFNRYSGR